MKLLQVILVLFVPVIAIALFSYLQLGDFQSQIHTKLCSSPVIGMAGSSINVPLYLFWLIIITISFSLFWLSLIQIFNIEIREYMPLWREYHRNSTWGEKLKSALSVSFNKKLGIGRGEVLAKHEEIYNFGRERWLPNTVGVFSMALVAIGVAIGFFIGEKHYIGDVLPEKGASLCINLLTSVRDQILIMSIGLSILSALIISILVIIRDPHFREKNYRDNTLIKELACVSVLLFISLFAMPAFNPTLVTNEGYSSCLDNYAEEPPDWLISMQNNYTYTPAYRQYAEIPAWFPVDDWDSMLELCNNDTPKTPDIEMFCDTIRIDEEYIRGLCGDGICSEDTESLSNCPQDCYCGNSECETSENPCTCQADCW